MQQGATIICVSGQEVKRSTVHFSDFIAPVLKGSGPMKVMDMGCGAGSSTYYLASRNRNVDFMGLDISAELIQIAGELSAAQQTANLSVLPTTGEPWASSGL